jgi:uncharacterized membrane protein
MNKARIEALSDGVFSIAMTILIIEIHVPVVADGAYSLLGMWNALSGLLPAVASYAVSFTVLAMYWTSHHALFHFFTKTVDRTLLQLNMLYLMLLVFIPFSTALLSNYHTNLVAVWLYGVNIIAMGVAQYILFIYAIRSKEIERHNISSRMITQAKVRILLTPSFAFLAMLIAIISEPLAFFMFIFPVVFNLVPGSLNATERFFGITIR